MQNWIATLASTYMTTDSVGLWNMRNNAGIGRALNDLEFPAASEDRARYSGTEGQTLRC